MSVESVSEQPAHYFDVMSGQLFIGAAVVDAHIEAGGNPADVHQLSALLMNKPLIEAGTYGLLDVEDWTREDYLIYGRWLIDIVKPAGGDISANVIMQASRLGVGPTVKRFEAEKRFGTLSKFYVELGNNPHYTRGLFDDWSQSDYIDYASRVAESYGGKPTSEVFRQFSFDFEGPSPQIIRAKFGSIKSLLERIGYPNIESWDEADYVDWGVNLLLANDGKKLNRISLDYLSKMKRGPSARTIVNHFGYLSHYKKLVLDAYDIELARRNKHMQERLESIGSEIDDGTLPESLFWKVADVADQIQRFAQFKLARFLLPDLPQKVLVSIGSSNNASFISDIREQDPRLTGGQIETTAVNLGLFDDIWPFDDFMTRLKVPD